MLIRVHFLLALGCISVLLASCSRTPVGKKYKELPTVPVHGKLLVDGKPIPGWQVYAIPLNLPPLAERSDVSLGVRTGPTDASGEFWLTSYKWKDGLPPGEYALTFNRKELTSASDPVNERYNTAEKSPKRITVEAGKPLDVGLIEITTE